VTGGTGSFGNLATTLQTTTASGTDKNGATLNIASGVSTGTGSSGINFNIYKAGSTGATANGATTAMSIASTGTVGISGATTTGLLSVTYTEADTFTAPVIFNSRASSLASAAAFQVVIPSSGSQKAFQLLRSGDGTSFASFEYNTGGSGLPGFALGAAGGSRDTSIYRNGVSQLRTNSTLLVDGSVGIGTATPLATLDVNGYAKMKINASAPVTCSGTYEGAMAYMGTTTHYLCFCDGTSWKQVSTPASACTW